MVKNGCYFKNYI